MDGLTDEKHTQMEGGDQNVGYMNIWHTFIVTMIIYDNQNYFAFKLMKTVIIQEVKICIVQPRIIWYVLYIESDFLQNAVIFNTVYSWYKKVFCFDFLKIYN